MQVEIRQGFDIPVPGAPRQVIDGIMDNARVAVLGGDFVGLKPRLRVQAGDSVRAGQPLFENKRNGLLYPAPASGTILNINWGPRHSLLSVEIETDDTPGLTFPSFAPADLHGIPPDQVRETLLASGLWTAFRARPFGHNPGPGDKPQSLFITAIDTQPLAADPAVVIDEYPDDFAHGLAVLERAFAVPLYLCKSTSLTLPDFDVDSLRVVSFTGPHPAGLVGTHIHHLSPASQEKPVWHLGYQDVIAIGKLFTGGYFWTERIIALGGPQAANPRLVKAPLGVRLEPLAPNEMLPGTNRILSGSVLCGHPAVREEAYLGRYHTQVTIIEESRMTELRSGNARRFSRHSLLGRFSAGKYCFDTQLLGERRPMYPLGDFEALMPLDLLPTPLLRALLVEEDEEAMALGCLELVEEDLALCTWACVSKNDYGSALRKTLDRLAGFSE